MNKYTLPDLPYDYAALEPHISAKIMQLHHDKHHAAYVAGANKALENLENARKNNDFSLINQYSKDLSFNLAGHNNHCIFWTNLAPKAGGEASGEIAYAIKDFFGSFSNFQAQFTAVATSIQGSGWACLGLDRTSENLVILQFYDHQNNLPLNITPLLLLDMWEHAFYLDYLNVKTEYVKAFWNIVNWENVEARFNNAMPQDCTKAIKNIDRDKK